MSIHVAVLGVLFAAASACGGGDSRTTDAAGSPDAPASSVEFVDVPPYVGHQTVTQVVAHDPAGVTRVELYLDDMRVSAVDFAPFNAAWDASGFSAGAHRLRALAYTSDGRILDASIEIRIDHTGPRLDMPASATRDIAFVIDAADDEAGLARVVVQRGDETLATLTAPPYELRWPGGLCGDLAVRVTAIDRAGNETRLDRTVAALDTHDIDCDGESPPELGGADCDDHHPTYGPHAPDLGTTIADFNCDGVAGVDADHDGVPSLTTGGTDCDETAIGTHGAWASWVGAAFDITGMPAPNFVSIDNTVNHLYIAFIDHDRLFFASRDPTRRVGAPPFQPELVASVADEASGRHPVVLDLGSAGVAILFFAGNALDIATRSVAATAWTVTEIDPGAGPRLKRVDAALDRNGALHVVYEETGVTPSQLRYATNRGGTWARQALPEGSDAQDSPKIAVDDAGTPHVIYENTTEIRHAALSGDTWVSNTVFADRQKVSYYTIGPTPFSGLSVVAVFHASNQDEFRRGAVADGFLLGSTFATVPELVVGLASNIDQVVALVSDRSSGARSTLAVSPFTGPQNLQANVILGASRPTSLDLLLVLAPGTASPLLAHQGLFIGAPLDPSGGPDLDCNGRP